MCVIRDECVLLVMLTLQLVGGLPVMALMKMCGLAYVALYVFGAVLSVSLTFAPRLRWCCSRFVGFINEFGICLFLLTHTGLFALSTFTLYSFLVPFFHTGTSGVKIKGNETFEQICQRKKLHDNLSHTGCDRLQGNVILGFVVYARNMYTIHTNLVGGDNHDDA